jgi:hypothetical protein
LNQHVGSYARIVSTESGKRKTLIKSIFICILGDAKTQAVDIDQTRALLEKAGADVEALALRGALLMDTGDGHGNVIPLLERAKESPFAQAVLGQLYKKGIYGNAGYKDAEFPAKAYVKIDGNKINPLFENKDRIPCCQKKR